MTLAHVVASYVVMQGRTDSDAVERAFPHIDRQKIKRAIWNAYLQGRIHMEQKGKSGWARAPSILCAPLPDQPKLRGKAAFGQYARIRVASVWDLAAPKPLPLPDLPGRQYTPLGPWSDLEGAAAA
jgi:hypothetical protein